VCFTHSPDNGVIARWIPGHGDQDTVSLTDGDVNPFGYKWFHVNAVYFHDRHEMILNPKMEEPKSTDIDNAETNGASWFDICRAVLHIPNQCS